MCGTEQNHNPRSVQAKSLEFPRMRRHFVRSAVKTQRQYPDQTVVIHIPADLDGVVP